MDVNQSRFQALSHAGNLLEVIVFENLKISVIQNSEFKLGNPINLSNQVEPRLQWYSKFILI